MRTDVMKDRPPPGRAARAEGEDRLRPRDEDAGESSVDGDMRCARAWTQHLLEQWVAGITDLGHDERVTGLPCARQTVRMPITDGHDRGASVVTQQNSPWLRQRAGQSQRAVYRSLCGGE